MTARYRQNFKYGIISGTLTTTTGTLVSAQFAGLSVTNGYLPITLSPGYYGASTTGEIAYITATNGVDSVTVTRAQEGTSAITGSGVAWVAGALASDFGLANQIANGDFPTPTYSGQLLVSTSTSGAVWSTGVTGLTINNSTITGTSSVVSSGVTMASGVVYASKSIPSSGIAPGTTGQILVTSGGNTTWRTPQFWNIYSGALVSNLSAGTNNNPVVQVTVSGFSTYLIQARAFVSSSGVSCNAQMQLSDHATSTALSGTYQYSLSSAYPMYIEFSIFSTWQPGDTSAHTIDYIISNLASAVGTVHSQRGQINVTGIA